MKWNMDEDKFCQRGSIMGDIMIFGQNSLNLNFEHCVD